MTEKVEEKDLKLVEIEKVLQALDILEDGLFQLQAFCKAKKKEIMGR